MNRERSGGGRALLWMALIGFALMAARACQPAPEIRTADGDVVDLGSLKPDAVGGDFADPPETRRILLPDGERLHEGQVAEALAREHAGVLWSSFTWVYGNRPVTTVAPGLDRRHHFANGFLVGYVPYPDVEAWVPLYALARDKAYQFDHDQMPGVAEIWQTSREAFHYPTGDCEDHAIALADWLIGLGHDARVVIGTVDGGGHAWVVLFEGPRTYLLEATDKNRRRNRMLPLAEGLPEYRPEAMFDRRDYWVNDGSTLTTDYRGAHWQLRSRFRRG